MFKYLIDSGSNYVYFFKTIYDSTLNILKCGEKEDDCEFDYDKVKDGDAPLEKLEINEDNYN